MQSIVAGDLIFQVLEIIDSAEQITQQEQQFNEAVSLSAVAQSAESMPVNHVGLAINEFQVIEATTEHGVVVTDLSVFLARSTKNIVAKIKKRAQIDAAINRAKTWIGASYNASFYPDQMSFYCSELITKAFTEPEQEGYFQLHPMNFKAATTSKILPYWVDYYEQLNMPIPHGVMGSHPAQLLGQRHLFSDVFLLDA